jgi:hypothetical protein
MKINCSDFLILISIGLGLLLFDRFFRINSIVDSFENPVRCGVDMPPCAFKKRCANGFCISPSQPDLSPNTLPVFP